ncbi:MAG: 4-phosphoerythronate dehydrogenase [Rhodothermales bacterium]
MPTLRIVADENIPLARDLFGKMGEVRLLPGRAITREKLEDADVLLVRSVTRVDENLLKGTRIRFVGTATIGTDHIETDYLHQHEISWASAPASNADSVVEYVLAVLLVFAIRGRESLRGKVLGVVGCGSVGSRVARRFRALGMNVLKNDPPLARQAEAAGLTHSYHPLGDVLEQADVLTCHVPLTSTGPDATYHLIGPKELDVLGPHAWLLNTSRGPVVDNEALLEVLRRGWPAAVALDVWENEPVPASGLIERVHIATPHIAGYSYEGKVNGALMLLDALADHLGVDPPGIHDIVDTSSVEAVSPDPALPETDWLHHLVKGMYDVAADDRGMRLEWPLDADRATDHFTGLRRTYPKRRTFGAYHLRADHVPEPYRQAVEKGVGVRLEGSSGTGR